ncbi:hypothetical protein D3C84_1101520 [compost metagenome]
MIRWRHGDDRIVEEWQELQAHVLRHHGHDDQVVTVVREASNHLATVDHRQLQVDLRMLALERGKQVRDEVLGA